jgi:predicted ABC-type ATPase
VRELNLYIIGGCNGAGKTTASFTILPDILNCREFVNADEIAKGISPFQPEQVAFEAGRIMLRRIDELLLNKKSFAFETTLASKSYRHTLLKARENGYFITLLFFWLQNTELAKERVKIRVAEGGHNIEQDIIERRYWKGISNLFNIYLPLADHAMLFDNSEGDHDPIADKKPGETMTILNKTKFELLKSLYEHSKQQ